MDRLGWRELDILLITGDAYVDHPAFGTALLGRWLARHGYRVGVCAQPGWKNTDGLLAMGRPRLFAGINAGAIDSMLAHYTAFRKKRHDDSNSPGGRTGKRPNRACLVYANLAKRAFPGLPLILGGIEASLRRLSHYDFWADSLRKPLLLDAKADLLLYGMGERSILELARRIEAGSPLQGIFGSCWLDSLDRNGRPAHLPESLQTLECLALPSHEEIEADPFQLVRLTAKLESHVHSGCSWAFSRSGQRCVVLAPPSPPLDSQEMDELYALPFCRRQHPSYKEPVPAAEMLRASITSHRGCGGGCSFCSLALHQGRRISSRSRESILDEAARMRKLSGKQGAKGLAISDIGGPTANMWQSRCQLPGDKKCRRKSCCYPEICKFFVTDQRACLELMRSAAALPGIARVRVASGVRPDVGLGDRQSLAAYAREFTGGQLKLAPEHCSEKVLRLMRKPPLAVFEDMAVLFRRESRSACRRQFIVPYLMSAFPGCGKEDMKELASWLADKGWHPQQVQCFIPTPGTMATAMFYSGKDEEGRSIEVARSDAERMEQHRLLMPHWGNKAGRKKKASDFPQREIFRIAKGCHP